MYLFIIYFLSSSKNIKPGFYEKEQLTINIQLSSKNKNLKEIIKNSFNINFNEYEKIKNYAIKSTIRNITSTSNIKNDSKYIYVYAPNYFSSLSEDQLNGDNFKYLIGINHLFLLSTFSSKNCPTSFPFLI